MLEVDVEARCMAIVALGQPGPAVAQLELPGAGGWRRVVSGLQGRLDRLEYAFSL
jgi:hypothetical protein